MRVVALTILFFDEALRWDGARRWGARMGGVKFQCPTPVAASVTPYNNCDKLRG